MRLPWCQAEGCDSIAQGRSGLCPAHVRAITFTAKLNDLCREFLHGNQLPHSCISLTNLKAASEAGEYLAVAAGLLIGTLFDQVDIEPEPIGIAQVSAGTLTPWRVCFAWRASRLKQNRQENNSADDDEQLIEESSS